MTFINVLLFFYIYLNACFSPITGAHVKSVSSIEWPNKFHVKYEVLDIKNGIRQKLEAWHSEKYGVTRVDSADGAVKKYITEDKLFLIHPETSMDLSKREIKCFYRNLTDDDYSRPSILPSKSGYRYTGNDFMFGREVDVWYARKIFPNEFTVKKMMYTYRDTKAGYTLPLKSEFKLLQTNGLKTHVIIEYQDYESLVTGTDITLDENPCKYVESLQIPNIDDDYSFAFDNYKILHEKQYSSDEEELRKYIFYDNWREIKDHNSKNLSYKKELNKFSDRTPSELCALNGLRPSNTDDLGTHPLPYTENELSFMDDYLPEEFDLRLKGIVTPVRNQKTCGSCWAFSTVAAAEGALALNNGGWNWVLSEQSLVDCAWGYECLGCNGGEFSGSFRYVAEHGITTTSEYGLYSVLEGYCHVSNATEIKKVRGYGKITPRSETALKVALNKYGPVAVGIHASNNIYSYSSGVFYDVECDLKNGTSINHGVTVVGYGVRNLEPYWLVKNSWGTDWGEDGYILMSATNNNCFVLDEAYYFVA